jgi:hypothetical protein
MAVTSERLGEPRGVAVAAAKDDFALNLARISLNGAVTNITGDRQFAT